MRRKPFRPFKDYPDIVTGADGTATPLTSAPAKPIGEAAVTNLPSVAPPTMGLSKCVWIDENYVRELEEAKRAILDMRFHLEDMPCRNNGGALVRWKIRAAELIRQGMVE